jgi:chitin synthase
MSVFLSQRRRWSLGSATHGMWMVFMPNIPIWERFSSFVFVLTYLITPFFMYSLTTWIAVIAKGNYTDLFWILTGIVQIVTLYKLLVPLWLPMTCK